LSTSPLTPEMIKQLLSTAQAASAQAYVPYSRFPVGAALLVRDASTGQFSMVQGCNVENASFGLAICAERVAITKAVSEGHRQFLAIAVTSKYTQPCFPCGTCLQFIREFGDQIEIFFEDQAGQVVQHQITDMLPYAFTGDNLPPTHPIEAIEHKE